MASITIRKLDDGVKERLRVRAARHGRSMEAEARSILAARLASEEKEETNLVALTRKRFGPLGGVVLPEIPRETTEPVDFGE